MSEAEEFAPGGMYESNPQISTDDPDTDPRAALLAAIDVVLVQAPLVGLSTVRVARTRLDEVQELLVADARRNHFTWRQIGEAMGAWATNVHRRYHHLDDGSREPNK